VDAGLIAGREGETVTAPISIPTEYIDTFLGAMGAAAVEGFVRWVHGELRSLAQEMLFAAEPWKEECRRGRYDGARIEADAGTRMVVIVRMVFEDRYKLEWNDEEQLVSVIGPVDGGVVREMEIDVATGEEWLYEAPPEDLEEALWPSIEALHRANFRMAMP
jgi:hypothetical protein